MAARIQCAEATLSDVPQLAQCFTAAFTSLDPEMHKKRWGDCSQEEYDRFQEAEWHRWLTTPHIRCQRAVRDGEMLGLALWFFMTDPEQAYKDDKPMTPLPPGVTDLLRFFYAALEKAYKSMFNMPRICNPASLSLTSAELRRPESDLHILGVSPKAQRQGVGKALLAWGFEQSRQLKLPINLEASSGKVLSVKHPSSDLRRDAHSRLPSIQSARLQSLHRSNRRAPWAACRSPHLVGDSG